MTQEQINQHNRECERTKKDLMSKGVAGKWNNEPNRMNWRHAGFDCMIVRNHHMAWCGYVAVPKGHKLYGKKYTELEDIDVHGELTYSDKCQGDICHEGEADVWWFGFDCAHFRDIVPALLVYKTGMGKLEHMLPGPNETYKDMHFATVETEKLAQQISAITH